MTHNEGINMSTENSLNYSIVLAGLVTLILVTSCAEAVQMNINFTSETYGFWSGLLHGIILPFSFIGSLFNDEVAIYAINNTGGWYDFGFVFGASIIFGGGSKSASRRKDS